LQLVAIDEPSEGMDAWAGMGISEPLLKALQLKGFTTPTQVQVGTFSKVTGCTREYLCGKLYLCVICLPAGSFIAACNIGEERHSWCCRNRQWQNFGIWIAHPPRDPNSKGTGRCALS